MALARDLDRLQRQRQALTGQEDAQDGQRHQGLGVCWDHSRQVERTSQGQLLVRSVEVRPQAQGRVERGPGEGCRLQQRQSY